MDNTNKTTTNNMKKLITILSVTLTLTSFQQDKNKPCPTKGDNDKQKFQYLDSLKNRQTPGNSVKQMDVETFLLPGNDATRFDVNQYVTVCCYVVSVKYGGTETCECHDADKSMLDYHIEVASSPTETDKKRMMVCEVTRFSRSRNAGLTYDFVKSFVGKHVLISGWLFSDDEHKQNAVNTMSGGTFLWRSTIWEIHPVFEIILAK